MHRIMLTDIGISFSERDLKLHQFIIGLFSIAPAAKVVKEAREWSEKLIIHNRRVGQYDAAIFSKTAEERWSHLFYLLVPYGMPVVLTYLRVSKLSWPQVSYYTKYLLNKLIGRK
jgi:hypothetical protein